ncbi:hypothetical protein ACFQJ5_08410 [Halomicroarcula sp. GCM10025324]|uniref:DUF7521 family protein n=1 Tax=Haloarcula TaxID=2237 RepID=UPI0023E8AACF|nr:hypothetical protein [Halomicroarcula sp. ZS-22-S1]
MHIELVIAKIITAALGVAIAYQAYRGYQRTGSDPLRYVAVGFVFISVGAVLEGILFDVLGLSIFDAGTIQTGVVAVGMLFILYALYGGNRELDRPRAEK